MEIKDFDWRILWDKLGDTPINDEDEKFNDPKIIRTEEVDLDAKSQDESQTTTKINFFTR